LRDGLSLRGFLLARWQRVYPLCWLGALAGCLFVNGNPLMLLLIPTPSPEGLLFSANAPLWSLLFELAINAAWAILAVQWRMRTLLVTLAGLGALFSAGILIWGSADLGAHWQTVLPGLARTAFSFTFGVILFRVHAIHPSRKITPLSWLVPVALVALLVPEFANRAVADILTAGIVLPLLVWLGARWEFPLPRLAERLGGLSFALYCLHAPFVAMGHSSTALMASLCLALIAVALLLDRYFDRPIQAWLRLRAQSACPAPQALA
jgi:peptidoglycan/LPS O-acetylase OafA/YrhL